MNKLCKEYIDEDKRDIYEKLMRSCNLKTSRLERYSRLMYIEKQEIEGNLSPYLAAIKQILRNTHGKTAVEIIDIFKKGLKDLTGFSHLYMNFDRCLDMLKMFYNVKRVKANDEEYARYYITSFTPLQDIGIDFSLYTIKE